MLPLALLLLLTLCLCTYHIINRFIERRCLNRAFKKAKRELNSAYSQAEKNSAQAECEVLQVLLTACDSKKLVNEHKAS